MNNKTNKLVINAILLALLIVSSKIVIPIGISLITLQTIVVFVIILSLDIKNSLLVIFTYLFLGFVVSLPVFSNGGGLTYLYNPTCGFLFGFVASVFPIKLLMRLLKIKNKFLKSSISSFFGLIVIYFCGCIYALFLNQSYDFVNMFTVLILPTIIFDILKIFVSSLIYTRVDKHIRS